jgi:hypothetical protein
LQGLRAAPFINVDANQWHGTSPSIVCTDILTKKEFRKQGSRS